MAETSQSIFEQISTLFEEMKENQEKGEAGNKAARGRARKAAGEIKKLITPFRQASVADGKK